jgi:hypothetical protein
MCILMMPQDFLNRDAALSRSQLDAGQGRAGKKTFYRALADAFNGDEPFLDSLVGTPAQVERYKKFGLDPVHSGYKMTPEKAEELFKEMRATCMSIQSKFRQSGMGDCGTRLQHMADGGREHSVTVFSSNYKDFCVGQPVQEFFFDSLVGKGLLASAASDMPAEACSSSSNPGSTQSLLRARGGRRSIEEGHLERLASAAEVSPDSKKAEKRAREAIADGAEQRAINARVSGRRAALSYGEELDAAIKRIKKDIKEAEEERDYDEVCILERKLKKHKTERAKLAAADESEKSDQDGAGGGGNDTEDGE